MLDELDLALLRKLEEDGRKPVTQLSRELGRPTPSIRDRLRRLEETGIIKGYTAILDTTQLGMPIKALILLSTSERTVDPESFLEALETIPEVTSVDLITGTYEAVATVHARDMAHLSDLLYHSFRSIPGITGTNTAVVLHGRQWHLLRGQIPLPTSSKQDDLENTDHIS